LSEQLFSKYIGRRLGGCEVRRRVGSGGMGVVFEAHHLALDKRVALKLLMPNLAADGSFVRRFVSEARLAAQVEHPNIVQILNVGQDGDVYFIVMQFIEGKSLAEMISQGPLSPREAAKIALQAARGLAAAHRRGIIHRDVKPENILVDRQGLARIVDMGLSKNLSAPTAGAETSALTAPGVAMGTPNYISPEQATEARAADARTDIYSLGATLYHALAGAPPFSGPSAIAIINQHINAPLRAPSARRPEVPAELDRLVGRMMAKQPDGRIQTMDEVVAELKKYLAGAPAPSAAAVAPAPGPAGQTPAAVPVKIQAPARSGAWKYLLLGAAGMLGLLIALAVLGDATDPARKDFLAARAYQQAHPDDYDGAIAGYRQTAGKFPESKWRAKADDAAAAVVERRAADGQKAFDDRKSRAGPLEKSGDWTAAEKLWRDWPAQLKDTPAGKAAAERAEAARVAGRSAELFAAVVEGNVQRAAGYCDPRKNEKAIQFLLNVLVLLVRAGKGTPEGFRIEPVAFEGPDRATLRMRFTVTFGALKPPEDQEYHQAWERVNGEWYLVENKRLDEPGPRRPRPGERPERHAGPGRPGAPETP